MRILVFSPVPSDPHHQGNSVRITRINQLFQYFGCTVHFLYYGLEGLDSTQQAAMTERWDHFHFVRCDSIPRQTRIDGYGIDDWFGKEARIAIKELQNTWSFDAIFCNYVWMSAALDLLPNDVFKIIDTHDVFGDRQYTLQSQSVAPAWIYMPVSQERIGLDRADLVIAIQDLELEVLAGRTKRPVISIGHALPANFMPLRARTGDEKLHVGYIASDNPSNKISLRRLVEEVRSRQGLRNLDFLVAGRIGKHMPVGTPGFQAVGFVEDARDFYRSVDIVINPNVSGTGLKIKSVEALSFGVPFVSMADGMVGVPSPHAFHQCVTMKNLVDSIIGLGAPNALIEAQQASRQVFQNYAHTQLRTFERMLQMIQAFRSKRKSVA